MNLFFDNQFTLIQKNFGHLLNSNESNLIIRLDKGAITNESRELEARCFLESRANIREVKNFSHLRILLESLEVSDIGFAYVGAYRMIDSVFCGLCEWSGIKVVLYQHGMENNVQRYKVSRLRDKWHKVIYYSIFLFKYCQFRGYNSINEISQYIRYLRYNGTVRNSFQNLSENQPAIAYDYSDFYVNFWKEKWAMHNTEYRFVRFQDLDRDISELYTNKYVYIIQTFYEDGRAELSDYLRHISSFSSNEVALLVHPRTSVKLIKTMTLKGYEILKDLRDCKGYLGSSSSLLIGLAARNYNVYHVPFEDEIPNFINKCLKEERSKKFGRSTGQFCKIRCKEISGITNDSFRLL